MKVTSILRTIYLSPIGLLLSAVMSLYALLHKPFMAYGYFNRPKRKFNKLTRISSTAVIIDKKNLDLEDNTWIWHYSILDASNGLRIAKGCQIGAWVGIFTHGSHIAIRLLGEQYTNIDKSQRIGYQKGPVEINEYTFIGAKSIILPDVTIGKGCIVAAGSVVSRSIPDYSIVSGNPAEIIGDTRTLDKKYFKHDIVQNHYYDKDVLTQYRKEQDEKIARKDQAP